MNLKEKAKYFNMRLICEKAGISYNTFRSYACGRYELNDEQKKKLEKAMKEVANM